jgi:sensor domain CHASE-containing protein
MAFNKVFNAEEQARLKQLIQEGCQVKSEVETLNEGLRETVKAIAEELEIKPAILNKAINTAHKANFQDQYDDFDALETILDIVGRKQ